MPKATHQEAPADHVAEVDAEIAANEAAIKEDEEIVSSARDAHALATVPEEATAIWGKLEDAESRTIRRRRRLQVLQERREELTREAEAAARRPHAERVKALLGSDLPSALARAKQHVEQIPEVLGAVAAVLHELGEEARLAGLPHAAALAFPSPEQIAAGENGNRAGQIVYPVFGAVFRCAPGLVHRNGLLTAESYDRLLNQVQQFANGGKDA